MSESERGRNRITGEGEGAGGTRRRRHVRTLLAERDGPVSIAEVTDHVVARERANGRTPEWSAVHEDLYYVTLPALTEDGHVAFDPQRGIVEPSHRHRDLAATPDRPATRAGGGRTRYAFVACAVGAVVMAMIALGVKPLAGVPLSVPTAALVATFVGLSVVKLGNEQHQD